MKQLTSSSSALTYQALWPIPIYNELIMSLRIL
jgi:hypothetical protein